jgi:hypothetical protein
MYYVVCHYLAYYIETTMEYIVNDLCFASEEMDGGGGSFVHYNFKYELATFPIFKYCNLTQN